MSIHREQKVVLITGGSGGIGQVTAIEFAKLGYKVAISGFEEEEQLEKIVENIASHSPTKSKDNFLAVRSNFNDLPQVDRVVEETVAKFGQIDILINGAGTSGKIFAPKESIFDPEFFGDYQRVLNVNLTSAVRVCQLAVPHLVKTKGVIITISSVADRWAMPNISYSVSKAGLSMLTKALANALEGTDVRVLAIAPGATKTKIAPGIELFGEVSSLNRCAEAQEIADLLVFLSSDKAAYIHGSIIDIDGGTLTKFGGAYATLRDKASKMRAKSAANSDEFCRRQADMHAVVD